MPLPKLPQYELADYQPLAEVVARLRQAHEYIGSYIVTSSRGLAVQAPLFNGFVEAEVDRFGGWQIRTIERKRQVLSYSQSGLGAVDVADVMRSMYEDAEGMPTMAPASNIIDPTEIAKGALLAGKYSLLAEAFRAKGASAQIASLGPGSNYLTVTRGSTRLHLLTDEGDHWDVTVVPDMEDVRDDLDSKAIDPKVVGVEIAGDVELTNNNDLFQALDALLQPGLTHEKAKVIVDNMGRGAQISL